MAGTCTSPWGLPTGTRWDSKNGGIPWDLPAGTLGPKKGWLWRPTSPGNDDMFICIFAPFLTQCVLKSWWPWTYQNSLVKRASMRVVLGWVTPWEVWIGGPKADNIVSFGVGRYTLWAFNWKWSPAHSENEDCSKHFGWSTFDNALDNVPLTT
jgi:hypothetical protein